MRTLAMLFDSCIDRFSRLLFIGGGIILLIILALTLTNIFMRALGHPLRGVIEISGYLGAAAIGLCLPQAQRVGSHLETGMLHSQFPKSVRIVLRGAIALACITFMLLLTWETIDLGFFVREGAERIDGWDFSYDTMVFALALGCAGQALVQLNDIAQIGLHRLSRCSTTLQNQTKATKTMDSSTLCTHELSNIDELSNTAGLSGSDELSSKEGV